MSRARAGQPHLQGGALSKVCRPAASQRAPRSLPALLETIGMPAEFCWSRTTLQLQGRHAEAARARHGNFWKRLDDAEIDIQDLAWEASRAYRRRMKALHPNRGGRHRDARRVTAAWAKVRRLLRARGAVV